MTSNDFGITSSGSTHRNISFIALDKEQYLSIVGRMVYIDFDIEGDTYRSIGTVTEVKTENPIFNPNYESIMARGSETKLATKDLRRSSFVIQATFKRNADGMWEKNSSALPTSPSTNTLVRLLDEEAANEMIANTVYPTIGYFRGMEKVAQPLVIPDFGGNVGAKSSGILGRSGSGKSSMYTMILGGYMMHEQHAILVIDPQGQWSNENGMIFSPQNFAKGLGRDVSVLRVSEDIKLPMDEEIFSRMLNKIGVWRKGFRRMAAENLEAFSDAVVSRLTKRNNFDTDAREMLSDIFAEIAASPSTLSRIYATKDNRERFQRDLRILAGEPLIDPETEEEEILTQADKDDVEESWERMLSFFIPLQNLFSSKNLAGGKRRPLGGEYGFLTEVFKVRKKGDAPAPYVVFDMSPSVTLHAKNSLLGGNDINVYMQKILDDQDIKALILIMMLAEMKRASEVAFASGEGNLNTQIVFDEAWRFAPEGRATPEIEELANLLEGFALDTRKFGIGWTYILQSPADLKTGIWRQLSYVYAGYGLVGEDVKRLETLTDDPKQLDLYRQFIPPASTNVYPFMILGPISPIIFTTAPAFINIFSGTEEFLEYNQRWISEITQRRSLPSITKGYMEGALTVKPKYEVAEDGEQKSFKVGKDATSTRSKPQSAKVAEVKPVVPAPVVDDGLDDGFPF